MGGCCVPVVGAVVQLVEYRTHNQQVVGSTRTRYTSSNLEQVANLLCAECAKANSASYLQIWYETMIYFSEIFHFQVLALMALNRLISADVPLKNDLLSLCKAVISAYTSQLRWIQHQERPHQHGLQYCHSSSARYPTAPVADHLACTPDKCRNMP